MDATTTIRGCANPTWCGHVPANQSLAVGNLRGVPCCAIALSRSSAAKESSVEHVFAKQVQNSTIKNS